MATNRKAKTPKPPKTRRRYSIGEWYGSPFETISPAERFRNARAEMETDTIRGLDCPFQKNRICSKKGGVCSLRRYEQTGEAAVSMSGPLVTTCPNRFLEKGAIFKWIGEKLLGTDRPIILRQVGFLNRFPSVADVPSDDEGDSRDFIGRIDHVLVHPTKQPLDWCPVELQAVYFSGKSMRREFNMLSQSVLSAIPFPAEQRRPDWRSSGPKRLLPQLQTKVPDIANWAKKMAVVVDEAFFDAFFGPNVPFERQKHLSLAQVAWCVVKYVKSGNRWRLEPKEIVLSKLDSSVKALTGGVPLSREQFEGQLLEKLPASFSKRR